MLYINSGLENSYENKYIIFINDGAVTRQAVEHVIQALLDVHVPVSPHLLRHGRRDVVHQLRAKRNSYENKNIIFINYGAVM